MLIDMGIENYNRIANRTRPLLTALEECIGQLEQFRADPDVSRIIKRAIIAADQERTCLAERSPL